MPTLKGSVDARRETTALNRVRLAGSGFLVDLPGWKPEIFWVSLLDSLIPGGGVGGSPVPALPESKRPINR